MKQLSKLVIVGTLSLILTPSAFAQTYDIAGVKLDMTPNQVASILESKGFLPDETFRVFGSQSDRGLSHIRKQFNFEQSLELVKMHRENPNIKPYEFTQKFRISDAKGVEIMKFKKNDGREKIEVNFVELPSGTYSQKVTYNLKESSMSRQDGKDKVIAKYGESDKVMSWGAEQKVIRDSFAMEEKLRASPRSGALGLTLEGYFKNSDYKKVFEGFIESKPGDKSTSF